MLGLPRGPLPALAAFALAAVVYVFGVYLPGQEITDTRGWEETPCTINKVVAGTTSESEPWGNTTRTYVVHRLEVGYVYAEAQTGQAVFETRNELEAAERREFFDTHPMQTCLVNPADPTQSVLLALQPGAAGRVAILAGVGLLVIIGLLALIAPFVLPKSHDLSDQGNSPS